MLREILLVLAGVALVFVFSGRLVRGVVGTSRGFGVSAFLISVIFLGFDPENLAVGAAGSYEDVAGIALGSIAGAAMVAFALAFGITALIAPMRFENVPKPVLGVPFAGVFPFSVLSTGSSRASTAASCSAAMLAVGYLVWLSRKGVDIESTTKPRDAKVKSKWRSAGLFALSLAGIVVGSEMLVEGSKALIEQLGLTDTFYGWRSSPSS